MSQDLKEVSYSQGEEELGLIEADLQTISTSSDFFEQEKIRQKQKRDAEKAQDIRDAMTMGENVPRRDSNWLKKYEESLAMAEQGVNVPANFVEDAQGAEDLKVSEQNIDQIEAGEGAMINAAEDAMLATNESDDSEDELSDELPMFEEADDEGEAPIDGELV
jgi:segregation and condensation protein B